MLTGEKADKHKVQWNGVARAEMVASESLRSKLPRAVDYLVTSRIIFRVYSDKIIKLGWSLQHG